MIGSSLPNRLLLIKVKTWKVAMPHRANVTRGFFLSSLLEL